MDWFKIFIAAVFEVLWVIGLKHAYDFWTWSGTAIAIFVSFYLLIKSGERLPVGTVYAVFVGLGTTGTVLADILFFGESLSIVKGILIGILLVAVIGLKVMTEDVEKEGASV